MKLQEIIHQVISQFDGSVLGENRFFYLLADYHAFNDYPAMKQVMKDLVFYGYGKGLYVSSQSPNRSDYLLYTYDVKKFLALSKHYKKEFADYAVDSISFALARWFNSVSVDDGWLKVTEAISFVLSLDNNSISEPSDHGFEPFAGKLDDRQEIVEAQYDAELGKQYFLGWCLEKNDDEALKCFRRAAEHGNSDSLVFLSFMYDNEDMV